MGWERVKLIIEYRDLFIESKFSKNEDVGIIYIKMTFLYPLGMKIIKVSSF